MSLNRKTALTTVERGSWEGNYFDSLTHAKMFRSYAPHNFGVKSAELFSSKLGSDLINKKFVYYTTASNNVYYTPGGVDDYEWKLVSPYARTFRVTEVISTDAQLGKNGSRFTVGVDTNGLQEPVLLKTESPNLPLLRIIGQPKRLGTNSWAYTFELQTGNAGDFVPSSYLQPGRELIDVSTAVSDELNQKYGGDQFNDMFKLQSIVGNFARKAEFTDKFIRTEIACRQKGTQMPKNMSYSVGGDSYADSAVGRGYVYQQNFETNSGKIIQKGVFVSNVEARLEERLMRDVEMNMEFGKLQITQDYDSGRQMKVAPGWREIRKDGHYFEHNGTLSLATLESYFNNIFLTRKEFNDRKIKVSTGEAGIRVLHKMVAAESSQYQTLDTLLVTKRTDGAGVNENELEFGGQFTKIRLLNGLIIEFVYDPTKDDPILFPEKAPGDLYTVESFTMDIYDFGVTDQKAIDAGEANMTCVKQEGVESYFTVSNVYDFETGAVKDGSNVPTNSKELGIYRETSGALCVWDVTRVGSIVFVSSMV